MMQVFNPQTLISEQQEAGRRYYEFLRVPDLSAGLYVLPAGGVDPQHPHAEDEFYVVIGGHGSFTCAGETRPVNQGDIIFVPAHDPHRFHDIAEDLTLLVFFGPAEGDLTGRLLEEETGGYMLTTDRRRVDVDRVHRFLTTSYWRAGCSRELIARAIANSFCFAIFDGDHQVAFGRVVTDYATFGYISDVFVEEPHRGRGLAARLIKAMVSHPQLREIKNWSLHTRDAHALYEKFGFSKPVDFSRYMEYRP